MKQISRMRTWLIATHALRLAIESEQRRRLSCAIMFGRRDAMDGAAVIRCGNERPGPLGLWAFDHIVVEGCGHVDEGAGGGQRAASCTCTARGARNGRCRCGAAVKAATSTTPSLAKRSIWWRANDAWLRLNADLGATQNPSPITALHD